jgi:hypothetical protein
MTGPNCWECGEEVVEYDTVDRTPKLHPHLYVCKACNTIYKFEKIGRLLSDRRSYIRVGNENARPRAGEQIDAYV